MVATQLDGSASFPNKYTYLDQNFIKIATFDSLPIYILHLTLKKWWD